MSIVTLARRHSDSPGTHRALKLVNRCLRGVREELADNPYVEETRVVLRAGGYRSAIGAIWNAVVDDLRNKIIHRSLSLFNKTMKISPEIKSYEDFQNITDDPLIEGAYRIGVIDREASKILKHAKESRHIFYGHPRSSPPSIYKVLAVVDDCVRYVLSRDYPAEIVDIDEYMTILGGDTFDRNEVGIENALGDLPELYKVELANRLFTTYIHPDSSTVLLSNIEFVLPILWRALDKEVKIQLVRRVDAVIAKGNAAATEQAFSFVRTVRGMRYLSLNAKRYKVTPLVKQLEENLGQWIVENAAVRELAPYAAYIPPDLLPRYVSALTHTFVGHIGSSSQWSRTDFYPNGAVVQIEKMFEAFDDRSAEAFVESARSSDTLRRRVTAHPVKLGRLRMLGKIVLEKASQKFSDRAFLEALLDEDDADEFLKELNR